jgi:hypothetical protein
LTTLVLLTGGQSVLSNLQLVMTVDPVLLEVFTTREHCRATMRCKKHRLLGHHQGAD